MGPVQRRVVKGVLAVVARPKLALVISGIVLAACVVLSLTRLSISTDQDKLFSERVAFFHDFVEYERQFPESDATYVVIEPVNANPEPPVERWTALADRITQRLNDMHRYVTQASARVPLEKQWAVLFEDSEKFPQLIRQANEDLVPIARQWGEAPSVFLRPLGRTPIGRFLSKLSLSSVDQNRAQFANLLAEGWLQAVRAPNEPMRVGRQVPDMLALEAENPAELGYYFLPDESDRTRTRHVLLVQVFHVQKMTSLKSASESVDAIRAAVRAEAKNFPDFKVGLTGRPVLDADEMRVTDRDSTKAEIIALSVIFLGLVLLLRSLWLAVVAELSLAVAIGWTFGWATLVYGELNLLSTVFLIALIGIGMDYLIQILAAYRREARRYVRPAAVWARVFRYVGPPVLTACLGAAGAFLVSVLTDFRGAAELGVIAGGGLLLCLVAGHTVLPALLVLFPAKLKPFPVSARYGPVPTARGPRRLLMPAIWAVLLLCGAPFAARWDFNPNLLDLQPPKLSSVQLVHKLQTWSAVVLSPDLEVLRKVREMLSDAPAVASTDSLLTALDNERTLREHPIAPIAWSDPTPVEPVDRELIAAKACALAGHLEEWAPTTAPAAATGAHNAATKLRSFADAVTSPRSDPQVISARLSVWQQTFYGELRRLMAQLNPPPLRIEQVPAEIRSHYVSQDGKQFALYIIPRQDLWQRENLERFVKEVEQRVGRVQGPFTLTGIAPNVYHSTSYIERAFYMATGYAVLLIFILVLLDLRSLRQTLVAMSVLALGLPMLVALMGLFGISWNFANFFALPILIGAGHEYGVFLLHRYREVKHNPRRVWKWWDPSDRALLLCAFVTCSSFAFFWALGHHRGLMSLGLVMALGTLCIYLSAIMVVRPLLRWRIERKTAAEQGAPMTVDTTASGTGYQPVS
jgi:predicted RND superfamily exporter protein